MKTVAMYLPQFHRIPENDAWWGEGFTDWETVKRAEPLFKGHHQPNVPLHDYYYDLTDKKVMLWQAELMHRYGIDGVCMYHYWFKDGRRVLEKPEQNLLAWEDVKIPFCFCWANETWARSWSNVKVKNTWASNFETEESDNGDNGILLLQDYGERTQWEAHFEYLLPYFLNERYIRIDDKPVFLIYRMSLIPCAEKMIACWRNLAINSGLEGLYIIGGNCTRDMGETLDGQLFHEPQASVRNIRNRHPKPGLPLRISAQDVWQEILRTKTYYSMQPFFEGFSGYDDTPRRGMEGAVITDNSPEVFSSNLAKLMKKNESAGADITFINALNEWGEGMYLEPDEKNGYALLEALKEAKETYSSAEYKAEMDVLDEEYRQLETYSQRVDKNLHVLDQWLYLSENGISIAEVLINRYGKDIAVYGYGILGKHLCREFAAEGMNISYLVDRNVQNPPKGIRIFVPEDDLPVCKCLVVTAPFYFDGIKEAMKKKGLENIVSIEGIVNENALENGL